MRASLGRCLYCQGIVGNLHHYNMICSRISLCMHQILLLTSYKKKKKKNIQLPDHFNWYPLSKHFTFFLLSFYHSNCHLECEPVRCSWDRVGLGDPPSIALNLLRYKTWIRKRMDEGQREREREDGRYPLMYLVNGQKYFFPLFGRVRIKKMIG